MTEQEKYQQLLTELRSKKGYICDMDGVIYHGNRLLPGVKEFVSWLYEQKKSFLFLTNASERSPKELQQKLLRLGLEVDESHFYTSAQATAKFIHSQAPGCSAYVIGGPGLVNALYDVGITMNDVNPDYVVVGETNSYNYNMILPTATSPVPPISASSPPAVRWSRRLSWRRARRLISSASLIRS